MGHPVAGRNLLRRAASLEWREPIILRPRPVLIMYLRLARKAFRMTSERLGSSVTISFSRSSNAQHLPALAHYGREGTAPAR